ncbi:hypothetical protein J2W80_005555 [Methylorubrum extorquens]|nr:hypothetical protein [Methylorubrum extorquens]MCP1591614.1 hypothetical protein [Methylorubrum extorquens]
MHVLQERQGIPALVGLDGCDGGDQVDQAVMKNRMVLEKAKRPSDGPFTPSIQPHLLRVGSKGLPTLRDLVRYQNGGT